MDKEQIEAQRAAYIAKFPAYLPGYWTERQEQEFAVWLASATASEGRIAELTEQVEALRKQLATEDSGHWNEGAPPHPYDKEWFIAVTIYGERVVLRALSEENTYDYKTADETYMLRKNVKRWMQFPDSEYWKFGAALAGSATPSVAPVTRIGIGHGAELRRDVKTTGAHCWLMYGEHGLIRCLDGREQTFVDSALAASADSGAGGKS